MLPTLEERKDRARSRASSNPAGPSAVTVGNLGPTRGTDAATVTSRRDIANALLVQPFRGTGEGVAKMDFLVLRNTRARGNFTGPSGSIPPLHTGLRVPSIYNGTGTVATGS